MPASEKHMIDIQKYFLLGLLILLLIALFLFISPFVGTLIIASVIVTGVYPIHKLFNKKLHIPSVFSALISLIFVVLVILTPLMLVFFLAANEASEAYNLISEKINILNQSDASFLPSLLQKGVFQKVMDVVSNYAPISTSDLISASKDIVGKISSILLGQTTNILKNLSVFIIHMVVFLLATFYFLKDGDRLVAYVKGLMPLPEKYRSELLKKLSHLSYGIIYGVFGAAIVQGALVGLGLALVGIKTAAFWGAMAAVFSPLPYIGTAVIWVPVVIALMVGGHWVGALFLLGWGITIVGMADNLVKPYIIGSSNSLHPLAVMLVLLGGAFSFGIKGLIFGPFVLTLALSFLHIYKLEYKSLLAKQDLAFNSKRIRK